MTEWLVTYLLHSTLVLGLTLTLVRFCPLPARMRDGGLRIALFLPLVTACLSVSGMTPPGALSPLTTPSVAMQSTDPEVKTKVQENTKTSVAPVALRPAVLHLALPHQMSWWVMFFMLGSVGWASLHYSLAWWRLPLRRAQLVQDGDILQALQQVTTRKVQLLWAAVPGPCALGHRTILLPPGIEQQLTTKQLEAVLAHECAHLLRRDPLWTVVLGFLVQVLWFQPLGRLVFALWRQASEEQCDTWAARRTSSFGLAQALLHLAQTQPVQPSSLLNPVAPTTHLTVRIMALLGPKEKRMTRIQTTLFVGVPVVLLAFLPALALSTSTSERKVVVLDAGHGGEDPGVVGYAIEKDVVLSLALQVRDELTRADVEVILTRGEDRRPTLAQRVDLAVRPVNLFLSLHMDANPDASQSGMGAYIASAQSIPGLQKASRSVAEQLLQTLTQETDVKYTGIQAIDASVLTKAKVPAVMINVGFATNAADGKRLSNPEYQKQLASDLAQAILTTLQ